MKLSKMPIAYRVVLKIVVFFIFLELILRLGGFLFLSMQEWRNWQSVKSDNEFRILCLGGSETALGGRNTYPTQLQEILNASPLDIKVTVINRGIPNAKTALIAEQIDDLIKKYRPQIVTTMLGATDSYDPLESSFLLKPKNILTKHFRVAQMIEDLWQQTLMQRKLKKDQVLKKDAALNQDKVGKQLEEVLKINPNTRTYTQVGEYYRAANQPEKALGYFQKAVSLDPQNYMAWYYIAKHYQQLVDYSQTIDAYTKALRACPPSKDSFKKSLYSHLADCYQAIGQYDQAESIYLEAISVYPASVSPNFYGGLAWCYLQQEKYDLASANYKKAIEIKPDDVESWLRFAYCARALGNNANAEKILSIGIKGNPYAKNLYTQLGTYFIEDKKYTLAQEVLLRALKIPDPKNAEEDYYVGTDADIKTSLITVYTAENQPQKVVKLKEELNAYENMYNQQTKKYYRKILDALSQKGILLVAVQYPNRSINSLKQMLGSSENIVYVDNQTPFKEALKKATYYDYFLDRMFGDFGHFTPKGSRLIAENIADVVLRKALKAHIHFENSILK